MLLPWLVLLICALMLSIFRSANSYESGRGIVLLALLLLATLLRVRAGIASHLFVAPTLLLSGLFTAIVTLAGALILLLGRKDRKQERPRFISFLLPLYLLFGLVQQLFFHYVVVDTVSHLSSIPLTILLGSLYFSLFHISKTLKLFAPGAFFLFASWSVIYLLLGNIIWLVLSHALLATLFYAWGFTTPTLSRTYFVVRDNV